MKLSDIDTAQKLGWRLADVRKTLSRVRDRDAEFYKNNASTLILPDGQDIVVRFSKKEITQLLEQARAAAYLELGKLGVEVDD